MRVMNVNLSVESIMTILLYSSVLERTQVMTFKI